MRSPNPQAGAHAAALTAEASGALERGSDSRAAALAGDALRIEPGNAHAHQLLALIESRAGDTLACIALLERAARLAPQSAQIHYNLAVSLQQLGRSGEAMLEYAAALRLDPAHPGALWNYANLLRGEERFEAALGLLERLGAVAPDYPGHALATAICLFGLRRADDALTWYRRADPSFGFGDPLVAWEMAHCVLAQGDWGKGFDLYDRRFEVGDRTGVLCYPFPFTLWNGQPLAGRSILVHGEQGLGDEIMFANVIPELIEEAAHVTIVTAPALVRLFQQSFPRARVFPLARLVDNAWLAAPPPWFHQLGRIDYHVPIGHLGARRRRDVEAFPRHGGYLRATTARIDEWRRYLEAIAPTARNRPRIGLMWGANPARYDPKSNRRSLRKSIPPELLEPLAGIGQFVSLQNRDAAAGAAAAPLLDIIDCHREILDFVDTAALIETMDVVVSVDTSVLHLAGALGKRAIGLLCWDCDFRWGISGERTPWYPAMQLVRQSARGEWRPVVAEARAALARMAR